MSPDRSTSFRHPVDIVSLIAGVLFLAAALYWGLADRVDSPDTGGWFFPAILIGIGVIGLVTSRGRRAAAE